MLTTAQFVITAALITGTIVIYSQMKYIETKDTGYVKEQIASIHVSNDSGHTNSYPFLYPDIERITWP